MLEPGEIHGADCGPGWDVVQALVEHVGPFVQRLATEAVPRLDSDSPTWPLLERALQLRRLGSVTVLEVLRLLGASADDWLVPLLPHPAVRAGVVLPGLLGAY